MILSVLSRLPTVGASALRRFGAMNSSGIFYSHKGRRQETFVSDVVDKSTHLDENDLASSGFAGQCPLLESTRFVRRNISGR